MTREVWLTVRANSANPNRYSGHLELTSGSGFHASIPIAVDVADLSFPHPSLVVGGFDYANEGRFYDLQPSNRDAFLRLLEWGGVNAAWATHDVFPDSELNSAPKTFEDWLNARPKVARHYVYLAINRIAGRPSDPHTTEWLQNIARTIRVKGLHARDFSFLLVDEPPTPVADRLIRDWSHAAHANLGESEVWENPAGGGLSGRPELTGSIDVLCQHVESLPPAGSADGQLLADWPHHSHHALELYSTQGHAPARNPYADYRLLPWLAFAMGARAIHYWSMIDAGGGSSWRPYELVRDQFSPLYVDASSVTTTRQFEALREGIEDHTYLLMLKDAIAHSNERTPGRAEAVALLGSVPLVAAQRGPQDAEAVRRRILGLLAVLRTKP